MDLIGKVVQGRYKVISLVGSGGMSAVYSAQDLKFNRRVAMKTIRPSEGGAPEKIQFYKNALIQEAILASRLNHPGIVTIYDAFELRGAVDLPDQIDLERVVCIVMEYIDGLTLEKAMRVGAFSDRQTVLKTLGKISDALDHAHSQRIVHRDIKPANIMIRTDVAGGEIKIADFGIARESARGTHLQTTIVGTLGYMSPEQAQGIPADGRADLFSLAVVAHEMLAKKLPYPSKETVGVLDPTPDISLGAAAGDVFCTALDRNPAGRYGTCREFVTALERALCPSPKLEPEPLPPVQPTRRPRPRWLLIATVAAVLLLATFSLLVPWSRVWDWYKHQSPALNHKDGLQYVWIRAGNFMMGCVPNDTDCDDDERPRHQIALTKGFWMSVTEVTVQAFDRYVTAAGGKMPEAPDFNPGWRDKSHPIVNVSWNEASAFCETAGGRLPTEAEWEYAARGGRDGLRFPWGDPINHVYANYGTDDGRSGLAQGPDRWEFTAPVASFPPNSWGLFDMAGNVMEWTKDWYSPKYYGTTPSVDPRGPTSGESRVVRGGSWRNQPFAQRCSFRYSGTSNVSRPFLGFRCVSDDTPGTR